MNIIAIVNNKGGVGKTTSAVNLADHRLNVTEEIGQIIRSHYDDLVFRTEIRGNVRLKEAPSFGKSIFDYDHWSAGSLNPKAHDFDKKVRKLFPNLDKHK